MMKKSLIFFGSIATLAMLSIGSSYFYLSHEMSEERASKPQSVAIAHKQVATKEIQWMSFEEAIKRNKTEPKKIFIDIYTDWCGWCKVLDKRTYNQSYLVDYLNKNFHNVKFNAEQRESIVFSDREYKFIPQGRTGYHELAALLTEGKLSYPTLVFMNEKMEPITYVAGFQEAPDLMDMLVFLKQDLHLKGVNFQSFKQDREKQRAAARP